MGTQFPSDPNAPPRAKTGFMLFCDEKRPALMKKLAGQPVSAVAKELGKTWKEISSSEQAKYSKKAEAGKSKREAAMKKYEKYTSHKNYMQPKKNLQRRERSFKLEFREFFFSSP